MFRDIAIACCFALGVGSAAAFGVVAEQKAQRERWDDVLVVMNGTLVANPAALSGTELADATIIRKKPRLIGFNCNGRTLTGEQFSDFPMFECREVMTVEAATKEAQ